MRRCGAGQSQLAQQTAKLGPSHAWCAETIGGGETWTQSASMQQYHGTRWAKNDCCFHAQFGAGKRSPIQIVIHESVGEAILIKKTTSQWWSLLC